MDLFGLQTNVTVRYNSSVGVELIMVNVRYADEMAQVFADLLYSSTCINSVRMEGQGAVTIHGVADADLTAQCAMQLFSGCVADKEWALQCAFVGECIHIVHISFCNCIIHNFMFYAIYVLFVFI